MDDKLNMKLTLEVEGKEELLVTVEYKNTTIETVELVENALLGALSGINK